MDVGTDKVQKRSKYRQEPIKEANQRIIKSLIINTYLQILGVLYHCFDGSFPNTKLPKNIPQQIIRRHLPRNLPQMMQRLPNIQRQQLSRQLGLYVL